jgi:hypothetical protein
MPNDTKFGLVLGIGLVLLVATLYFRKDPGVAAPPAAAVSAQEQPVNAMPQGSIRHGTRPPPKTSGQ